MVKSDNTAGQELPIKELSNYTRFDLEQSIMTCWSMVDDLKILADRLDPMTKQDVHEHLNSLAKIYQLKFEYLFDMFSELVRQRKI